MKYFTVALCFNRERCDATTKNIMLQNNADGYILECVYTVHGVGAWRGKIYFNNT